MQLSIKGRLIPNKVLDIVPEETYLESKKAKKRKLQLQSKKIPYLSKNCYMKVFKPKTAIQSYKLPSKKILKFRSRLKLINMLVESNPIFQNILFESELGLEELEYLKGLNEYMIFDLEYILTLSASKAFLEAKELEDVNPFIKDFKSYIYIINT